MRVYKQLTLEQRYQLYAYMKAKYTQTEIADLMGAHKSTISRELSRNQTPTGYRPEKAHITALERRRYKSAERISESTWQWVTTLLKVQWSPEQISGWLLETLSLRISHERIYQFVYQDKQTGGDLYTHLCCQRKRRKRYGSYNTRGLIPNRVSIDERPAIVEKRKRIGDWEVDTVIGKNHQQAMVTLTERKTRYTLIAKVTRRTADQVGKAMIQLLKPVAYRVCTITSDNGKEFADHQSVANKLKAKFYFAHPYSSCERGLNENTNGLIRQYFPKRTDFTTVTDDQIEVVMDRLNNRPRKCLGFKTPNQVLFGIKPTVALQC